MERQAQARIKDMIAEHGVLVLTEHVQAALNRLDASVDRYGDVWAGHWLSAEELETLVERLERGV